MSFTQNSWKKIARIKESSLEQWRSFLQQKINHHFMVWKWNVLSSTTLCRCNTNQYIWTLWWWNPNLWTDRVDHPWQIDCQFICRVNLFHLFVTRQILKDIVHNFSKIISFLTVLSTMELWGKWTCHTCQGLELTRLKTL